MTVFVSPNNTNIQTCLRAFLLSVLPAGVEVIEGQDNQVPEPAGADFVVMTWLRQERLETNIDAYVDRVFTGSISGNTLTVSAILFGPVLTTGSVIFGVNIATGTQITAQLTGTPGGIGTYSISGNPQTIASETMAAGTLQCTYENDLVYQLDVHGPNSADNATIIAAVFRDDYACEQFSIALCAQGFTDGTLVQPLYADDPAQRPFQNDQNQIEMRWSVDVHIDAVQTVFNIPLQFGSVFTPGMISVDATYPPQPVL